MMEYRSGDSDTYEIKASDAGNKIQFQVVVTDNLGNVENGILYEVQVAETSTDDTNSPKYYDTPTYTLVNDDGDGNIEVGENFNYQYFTN